MPAKRSSECILKYEEGFEIKIAICGSVAFSQEKVVFRFPGQASAEKEDQIKSGADCRPSGTAKSLKCFSLFGRNEIAHDLTMRFVISSTIS